MLFEWIWKLKQRTRTAWIQYEDLQVKTYEYIRGADLELLAESI